MQLEYSAADIKDGSQIRGIAFRVCYWHRDQLAGYTGTPGSKARLQPAGRDQIPLTPAGGSGALHLYLTPCTQRGGWQPACPPALVQASPGHWQGAADENPVSEIQRVVGQTPAHLIKSKATFLHTSWEQIWLLRSMQERTTVYKEDKILPSQHSLRRVLSIAVTVRIQNKSVFLLPAVSSPLFPAPLPKDP